MKQKWLEQLSCVDDVYVEEAAPTSNQNCTIDATVFANNQKKKWHRSMVLVAGIACVLLLGTVMLFIPYRTTAMFLYRLFDPAHYELLLKIDTIMDKASMNHNFIETLGEHQSNSTDKNTNLNFLLGDTMNGSLAAITSPPSYKEITDNQAEGVIEGDLIKRSDDCIFYLYDSVLYAYSIEQEASKLLDSIDLWDPTLTHEFGAKEFYLNDWDFYLSEDCSTITVLLNYYDSTKLALRTPWVEVITLDVTDPCNITEINSIKVAGYYKSSRMIDGNLLLFTKVTKGLNPINYFDKTDLLPQIITSDGTYYIEAESIVYPEVLKSLQYTAIHMIDEKTLEIKDGFAYLSYSDNIYVSADYIYTSYTFTNNSHEENMIVHQDATAVSCLKYSAEGFEYKGDFVVDGYLENQYSMDEYEGILRMVTTINGFSYVPVTENGETKITEFSEFMNVSLYCVDIDTLSIIAEVDSFAPINENVESVRFDKNKAYVCTVYTPELKDPVFAFDLSDLSNITYVNTGVIEGYSYALVDLNNDYVLGLGVANDTETLKIEVYKEHETAVDSICSYTLNGVQFSKKYKCYYIDRENNLLGFGYNNGFGTTQYYVLLHFHNEQLTEVVKTPLYGTLNYLRGVYVDEHLYMFGKDGTLLVEKITLE